MGLAAENAVPLPAKQSANLLLARPRSASSGSAAGGTACAVEADDERGDIRLELWEALSRKAEGFEDDTGCDEEWEKVCESAARPWTQGPH